LAAAPPRAGSSRYADYLSTFNDGFNALDTTAGTDWPNSAPWSVYPFAAPPAYNNSCVPLQTTCALAMAGFDLSPVPQTETTLQYYTYTPAGGGTSTPNQNLLTWFSNAVQNFPRNFTQADFYRHFPWSGTAVTWGTDLYPQAVLNPFLGQFSFKSQAGGSANCTVTQDGPSTSGCTTTPVRADHYLYPRQCNLADLAVTKGNANVPRLRACGLNYELHHNGYLEEFGPSPPLPLPPAPSPQPGYWDVIHNAGMLANQYGRTSFLFAGVPGMQAPVSFYNDPSIANGLSVYEQVYNASIFSLYLPIANEADFNNAYPPRNYTQEEFYHTLLMTNHMESDPDEFAEGIRGKVLWHDEYRTERMYEAKIGFQTRMFAAAFDPTMATAPFHNNTCDGCHVRNGSGIPITPTSAPGGGGYSLDAALQDPRGFMTTGAYNPWGNLTQLAKDYTFTGQIRPMKLVFFDLRLTLPPSTSRKDDSVYSTPLAFSANQAAQARSAANTASQYYSSTVMNFYGDSFHLNRGPYNYSWNYVSADPNRIVVNPLNGRVNQELKANCAPSPACATYQPLQVKLGTITTDPSCQLVSPNNPPTDKPWPTSCYDINSEAIHNAINDGSTNNTPPCGKVAPPPCVGFLLLNGKRLGNLSAIEAIPNTAIQGFQQNQIKVLGATNLAGEVQYNTGSRDGVSGPYSVVKPCTTKGPKDCYIGRFGWLGDRVSLEDQVANAAFIEMNITSKTGYGMLYPSGSVDPIRYNGPNCGPADKTCVQSGGNSDLSEQDIDRMASYARWLGNPTRSDFTASLPDVTKGEGIFRQIGCNTCHVIDKIEITDPDDTMLTTYFRNRLKTRVYEPKEDKSKWVYPFLSYLGTDLLMHDMPADWPPSVTFDGSPPNAAMFRWTQRSTAS
jgi:Di-haem oxidoreductase, putative peroxidase